MNYNIIISILLLLSCIFISLGIGLILHLFSFNTPIMGVELSVKKGALVEGARNRKKKKSFFGSISKKVKRAFARKKKKKNKAASPPPQPPPPPRPYDAMVKLIAALQLTIAAKNQAQSSKSKQDADKAREAEVFSNQKEKEYMDLIKIEEVKAVNSSLKNPMNHITNIKRDILLILNSVDSDANKLMKIKTNIVLPNQPNNLEMIKKIEAIIVKENTLESQKLVEIRSLVS